ncbi:RES family NAD+ phosphorylase [Phenylobacterium sp.]|jgi:hypothetical protein|uniref:RES family NAD+ phosphorylase n=1 Tax=Phenylobacterium sp. TaxID=1871053 RepID=UPI000C95CD7F|nr:RES family NAD+ phosphorylase [Phenylobacterium sp.]MAK80587.1 hypothetical protein [Phenylobacterium sp.]
MGALCCPECFGDRGLRRDIIPSLSAGRGDCDYCGSVGVPLVPPEALADYFELLVGAYEVNDKGSTLVELMKQDWQLFSHLAMDAAHAKELLGDILNDGEIVRKRFSPSSSFTSVGLAQWETLREELMWKNRYFVDQVIDEERLRDLLAFLPADDMPDVWYRARIMTAERPYPIDEMGAPPPRQVSHGRANPPGIPYLYVGSKPETSVAEVRPHTGEKACVADFKIDGTLTAVDLRNPRQLVSPFLLADAVAIGQLRADIPFLERLGEELTRPVLPRGAAIDYIPSQYLCEFIKKRGYDGVIYRSSVSDGINLALFDPTRAVPGAVEVFDVTNVSVTIERS